jgi:hypothetical protein
VRGTEQREATGVICDKGNECDILLRVQAGCSSRGEAKGGLRLSEVEVVKGWEGAWMQNEIPQRGDSGRAGEL